MSSKKCKENGYGLGLNLPIISYNLNAYLISYKMLENKNESQNVKIYQYQINTSKIRKPIYLNVAWLVWIEKQTP